MGLRFSNARQPQLVLEGDEHAVLRLGWDFTYEHEHGFSRPFWNSLTGKTIEPPEGHSQPQGAQLVQNVLFSDYVHFSRYAESVPGEAPRTPDTGRPLRGLWLGTSAAMLDVPQVSQRLWEFRRLNRSDVDASWCEDVVAIWFRSPSETLRRFEESISEGTAVFGLTPRAPHNLGRMEPYLATGVEFAYSVLNEGVHASGEQP